MAATLTLLPEQRELLAQALADAVYYRDPPVHCPACATPDTLCEQCAAGLARARAYLTLGSDLGVPVPPTGSTPARRTPVQRPKRARAARSTAVGAAAEAE
jgi:hypothetical protein